jgi:hypothetical protein
MMLLGRGEDQQVGGNRGNGGNKRVLSLLTYYRT